MIWEEMGEGNHDQTIIYEKIVLNKKINIEENGIGKAWTLSLQS